MTLHGKHIIGSETSDMDSGSFSAVNPATGQSIHPAFPEATEAEVNRAMMMAVEASGPMQALPPEKIANFLDRIAEELLRVGDSLVQRANLETALPGARLTGERARTVNQIKMFADLVREGSWVEARIDRALPDRQPLPRPVLKRMLVPIGPVVVFGASNFPLAFSVAGGDTVSALAAGNPIVVKAHPAHPGTSEIAGRAIQSAVEAAGLPPGTFSLLHGCGNEVGLQLVRHPAAKAVAFTGSWQGGRALFDTAAGRPEPIPVFAEMGSTNPLFILPGALLGDPAALAKGLLQSVTLGVGQFCTKPGLIFGVRAGAWESFQESVANMAQASHMGTMLTSAIGERFNHGVANASKIPGVRTLAAAGATILATDAAIFRQNKLLRDEMFGPAALLITCEAAADLEAIARGLPGQLTATIQGSADDLAQNPNLIAVLQQKAGRLIFNGFPTGVEVCPAMHHGGPYPATTSQFTSVGTAAIARFTRPLCFQNFPDTALPAQLRNHNERKIWRLIDGQFTKDDA